MEMLTSFLKKICLQYLLLKRKSQRKYEISKKLK